MRYGRPFEHLPIGHPVELLRPTPAQAEPDNDVMSPGGRLADQMEQLREKMARDPECADLGRQLEEAKRDTVKATEAENRDRERRERQRAKKQQRRKERKALEREQAAVAPSG